MKFTEKYPDVVDPIKRFPEKMLGPHPEVIVGPGLAQTWRMYPCAACRVVTGFRLELGDDFPMAPCCSEECAGQLKANQAELTPGAAPVEVVHATCPCVDPAPLVPLDRMVESASCLLPITESPAPSAVEQSATIATTPAEPAS